MADQSPRSSAGSRGSLASLLELGLEAHRDWRTEELAAVLQYHLQAPLEFDLGTLQPGQARQLRDLAAGEGLLLKSLGDLFQHRLPPLELLQGAKDFAKSCLTAADAPLPKQVAAVLYYLSIGVAMTRLDHRISDLSDGELRKGLDWALSQSWVEAPTKVLLAQARARVAESECSAQS